MRFLEKALAWFEAHGVVAERVMTEQGPAFRSKLFAPALQNRDLEHRRTRRSTPRSRVQTQSSTGRLAGPARHPPRV